MPSLPAHTVPDLLAALTASDLNRPRLTWYGPDGERVELSARTLANWVAKSANLLVEELDVEPGQVIELRLPVHWKSLVLALAASAVGATATGPIVGGNAPASADLVASADPVASADLVASAEAEPAAHLVVALPALARRVEGELPPGAIDFAATVTGQDDVFVPQAAGPIPTDDGGGRVLVHDSDPAPLAAALAAWQGDGSVVLALASTPAPYLAAEQLTVPLPGD